jgi:hypothetical protein
VTFPNSLEREIGHPGGSTDRTGALIEDSLDLVPELLWPMSVSTFSRMRRDAKVRESLQAVTLPIRRARWEIDPNGARPDIVQLVAQDLGLPVRGAEEQQPSGRLRDRFSWDEHLRLALLELVYGHMPFEQLYRILPTGPGGALQARMRKLAPRLPQTIAEIKVAKDGGLEGIVQHDAPLDPRTRRPQMIGIDRLVWYAHDREGANWQGQSALRSAYRPWRLKDEALRVWATSLRRNGIGQPVYQGAEGEVDLSKGRELARRARVSEVSGAAVPNGAKLTFEGVRGSLPDHREFVKVQDEEIAASVLAEFLKLGSSESGSRALGETFVDFFLHSLHAEAQHLADVATSHVVEDLVDLNFGEDEQAPRVVVDDIGTDHRVTAEAISSLLAAGALTVDDELEDYVRRTLYRLPGRGTPRPAPVTATAGRARVRGRQVRAAVGPREPSPDEEDAQVDFDALHAAWQTRLDTLLIAWEAQRADQVDELLEQVRVLLAADDLAGLGAVTAPLLDGAQLLEQAMDDLAFASVDEALAEAARQGVTIDRPDVTGQLDNLSARALAVDELLARSLGDVAARQALLRYTTGLDVDQVLDEVREHIDGLSQTWLRDQLGGALTAAQNAARFAVMDSAPVRRIVASELLDGLTCEPCGQVDGREYTSVAAGAVDYPTGGHKDCLGGPRCRGTLIAIYESESPATVN